MADTTWGALEVVACPPEHIAAVLAVVNEYGLTRDCFSHADEDVLVLCEEYQDMEMRCGASGEIADALSDLDGVAFYAAEDPKYEWLGEVHYRFADGRSFTGDSDAEGQVVLTESQYRRFAESAEEDQALRAALDAHFGLGLLDEWRCLYKEASARPEGERMLRPA